MGVLKSIRKRRRHAPLSGERVDYPSALLEKGVIAPNFTLESSMGEDVSLVHFHGRPVILVFYPADWSPVCGDQVVLYNELLPEFERFNAQLLGVSVDSIWSHRAFAENRNLRFPLLADFEPKGEVAQRYGVYSPEHGTSERALFVLGSDGVIQWSYVSPANINPGANGILSALEVL